MPRKQTPIEAPGGEPAEFAAGSPEGNKPRDTRPRLSIILDENGVHPDTSRMKAETVDKVRQFLADPANVAAFGLSPGEVEAGVAFSEQFVDSFYDGLGKVEAFLCSVIPPKIPFVITNTAFTFTEQEKNLLRPSTLGSLTYLQKRFPWLFKVAECQDLVICATLNATLFFVKFNHAKKMYAVAISETEAEKGNEAGAGVQ